MLKEINIYYFLIKKIYLLFCKNKKTFKLFYRTQDLCYAFIFMNLKIPSNDDISGITHDTG